MVHVVVENGDGAILPTWTAVDAGNVNTPRALFERMAQEGWNVEVPPSALIPHSELVF